MTICKKISLIIIFFIVPIKVFAQYELGIYHIMQYRANVRMEPTRNSDIIAILSFHDKIEILENSNIVDYINNVTSYWYKIKYGKIIGYTFGGNIAYKTLITDIDKNGINDYFYVRYNPSSFVYPYNNDIVIYINNKLISTFVIRYYLNSGQYISFEFIERDGYVLIWLVQDGGDHNPFYNYYFKVNSSGKIEYLGEYVNKVEEIDYW